MFRVENVSFRECIPYNSHKHRIHGTILVYLPTFFWLIFVVHVSKYTIRPWILCMGLITPLKTPVCNPGILRPFIEITSPFDTPRKFNIAPKNRQSQRNSSSNPSFFKGYVKFRGVTSNGILLRGQSCWCETTRFFSTERSFFATPELKNISKGQRLWSFWRINVEENFEQQDLSIFSPNLGNPPQ